MTSDPFLAQVRQRDADKGHSPAGITMTQAEWDRRYLLDLLDRDRAALRAARSLVDEQAEDEELWFVACTAPEAYLQQELRRLHTVIEAITLAAPPPPFDVGRLARAMNRGYRPPGGWIPEDAAAIAKAYEEPVR